jgi:hypothetical protein
MMMTSSDLQTRSKKLRALKMFPYGHGSYQPFSKTRTPSSFQIHLRAHSVHAPDLEIAGSVTP